ncbi:MAG: prolipoprotein diacylglyceryl transferase [Saprospiraceae bacterium]|nr:prolipoprotein diacylglyceryl transferase [Saprospiraceae bacterium]
MEFPLIFRWGSLAVSAHFIFELLAFFIGFRYFLWLRNASGDHLPSSSRLTAFLGAAAGALLGSRLLGALEDPYLFFHPAGNWLYYFQSKTIIGALLGGLIGVELAKKIVGETRSSGDLFAFPLMLGMMIGRLGCFSMGVAEPTYGIASELPWAMDLGDGITRHPTALYEIMFLFSLWLILGNLKKRYTLQEGAIFKLFMVAYLLYRFSIAFIQPVKGWFGGLGTLQLACLLGLVYYYKVFLTPSYLLRD